MARRRKPEEPVQEAPAKTLEEELKPESKSEPEPVPKPEPEPMPKPETKRPKDAVLGYMREFYGYY